MENVQENYISDITKKKKERKSVKKENFHKKNLNDYSCCSSQHIETQNSIVVTFKQKTIINRSPFRRQKLPVIYIRIFFLFR